MMVISDERREVAETLRQMAKKHAAVEASRVAHALGLEYEVHGTVVAFSSADVQALADLIDVLTTRNVATDKTQCHAPQDFMCEHCGYWAAVDPGFRYCPECDAEVVKS